MTATPQLSEGLLSTIQSPIDLRSMTINQLKEICVELRQFLIDNAAENGGHFGASMGVVELTVALHYVFDTPNDQLIWDVGHQAYPHKILTGRRTIFHTNRRAGGISGFPTRKECEYDSFGVGHSSTSISAALGMAAGSRYKAEPNRHHIAVIGDGAMTAGMAFEAMNHAGSQSDANLLIVLNDNAMSIDPSVGALKQHLGKLAAKMHKGSNPTCSCSLFDNLGINYSGPIDGHDLPALIKKLYVLKDTPGPKILHTITIKGKGYIPAELNQTQWHAPNKFNKHTGNFIKQGPALQQPPKYQDVFGHTLLELARSNKKVVGVSPAMLTGSSMDIVKSEMPDRIFDVGIAEQHAVTFSAGMATKGLTVFCNIYSTFMQRGYDQVIHDVCLQNLPVIFCLDRAGLSGADGPTHHGAYDLAYLRCIPNIIVAAPMNEQELRNLLYTASLDKTRLLKSAFAIRYPRGQGVSLDWHTPFEELAIGTGRKICEGNDMAVLSVGHIGNHVKDAIQKLSRQNISVAHYDMRFIKPLDVELLHEVFSRHHKVLTVEDGCLMGGFGSAVAEFMLDAGYTSSLKRLGIMDEFVEHGEQSQQHKLCGIDTHSIEAAIKVMLSYKSLGYHIPYK